ncbi:MAG: ABC transporter permease [Kangiellaceae bacterium]|nr:ABC transporter permease [Kangiellaceae bacterium]MCW8998287.1 ABC transporter permease [Kangiellaceae bacterium]
MLSHNFRLAFRQLVKYRWFTLINLIGLTIGISLFVLADILVAYEDNHDHMFENRDRTFMISSLFSEQSGESISEYPDIRLAYGPIYKEKIPQAQQVVRSVLRRHIINADNRWYHLGIRFVDKGFSEIFNFQVVKGTLDNIEQIENSLVITESTSEQLFGQVDVIGNTITLSPGVEARIVAVIEDIAADSHFNSSLIPDSKLTVWAPIELLSATQGFELSGEWETLNPEDLTYVLLPKKYERSWLQKRVNQIFQEVTPESEKAYISGHLVRPVKDKNTQVWDALGFPVLEFTRILGLLILVTAVLNYVNLATSQYLTRSKEIGLRKTFGAGKRQLLFQFWSESFLLTLLASLIALSLIEVVLPFYNIWGDKSVIIEYAYVVSNLLLIAIVIGLIGGIYPAVSVLTKGVISDLSSRAAKGPGGIFLRNFMVALQFAISIFMLGIVVVVFLQNLLVKQISEKFPVEETLVIEHLDEALSLQRDVARQQLSQLKETLLSIAEIESVSFSSSTPFQVNGRNIPIVDLKKYQVNEPELEATFEDEIKNVVVDEYFFKQYNLELITGELFQPSKNQVNSKSNENGKANKNGLNVIINQRALQLLGFDSAQEAIGKYYYSTETPIPDSLNKNRSNIGEKSKVFKVVGVVKDSHFIGAHAQLRPIAFIVEPVRYSYLSIRLNKSFSEFSEQSVILKKINQRWKKIFPNHPVRIAPLETYFNQFYRIPLTINRVLTSFAGVALCLALIGLIGLSAFVAQRKTKEIGIRKVMGAGQWDIIQMLIWQFSKPVVWSLIIALPAAYWVSSIYLAFFPQKFEGAIWALGLASLIGIALSWGVVSVYAYFISSRRPVESLRYE